LIKKISDCRKTLNPQVFLSGCVEFEMNGVVYIFPAAPSAGTMIDKKQRAFLDMTISDDYISDQNGGGL